MTALFPEAVDRDPLDFNRTPAWCVELLAPYLGQPRTIVDAGCGDGAIGKVLRKAFSWGRTSINGCEINLSRCEAAKHDLQRPYNAVFLLDWLASDPVWNVDSPGLIISNPPFGLAALDFLDDRNARKPWSGSSEGKGREMQGIGNSARGRSWRVYLLRGLTV